jgi:hypothetical protein
MKAKWFLVPLSFAVLSCGPLITTGGKTYNLSSAHAPLTEIVENPTRVSEPTAATTVLNTVYVGNLAAFLEAYPPGSDALEALLRHEHVHSVHEFSAFPFVDAWFGRYAADHTFRWQEEQQGFEQEISYLVHLGYTVDAGAIATRLATAYRGLDGPMVSYEEALAWVQSVVAAAQGGASGAQ